MMVLFVCPFVRSYDSDINFTNFRWNVLRKLTVSHSRDRFFSLVLDSVILHWSWYMFLQIRLQIKTVRIDQCIRRNFENDARAVSVAFVFVFVFYCQRVLYIINLSYRIWHTKLVIIRMFYLLHIITCMFQWITN